MGRGWFQRARESVLKTGWNLGLYTPPDRRVLDRILADLGARDDVSRVLFVGVKAYNRGLARFFEGRTFATIDPNPDVARFGGAPHFVDLIQHLERHAEAETFDAVVLNGVIGFGLNDAASCEAAIHQIHRALRPGGELVLGVNDRVSTYIDFGALPAMAKFTRKPFALFGEARHVVETPFREETHTFELWVRG